MDLEENDRKRETNFLKLLLTAIRKKLLPFWSVLRIAFSFIGVLRMKNTLSKTTPNIALKSALNFLAVLRRL